MENRLRKITEMENILNTTNLLISEMQTLLENGSSKRRRGT